MGVCIGLPAPILSLGCVPAALRIRVCSSNSETVLRLAATCLSCFWGCYHLTASVAGHQSRFLDILLSNFLELSRNYCAS